MNIIWLFFNENHLNTQYAMKLYRKEPLFKNGNILFSFAK